MHTINGTHIYEFTTRNFAPVRFITRKVISTPKNNKIILQDISATKMVDGVTIPNPFPFSRGTFSCALDGDNNLLVGFSIHNGYQLDSEGFLRRVPYNKKEGRKIARGRLSALLNGKTNFSKDKIGYTIINGNADLEKFISNEMFNCTTLDLVHDQVSEVANFCAMRHAEIRTYNNITGTTEVEYSASHNFPLVADPDQGFEIYFSNTILEDQLRNAEKRLLAHKTAAMPVS